jgi:hypothetical protein
MRATSGIAVSLVLVVTAYGCSGSGGKSAADEFADRYCAEVSNCCARAMLPTDGQPCHDWLVLYAQGGAYNAEAGKACLAEVASQAGAGTLCKSLGQSTPPSACESVYVSGTGDKQPGDSCRVTGDCATSNEGEVSCAAITLNGSRIAKCQVQVSGKAGDQPCVGTQEGDDFVPYFDTDAIDVPARAYVCKVAEGDRCRFGTCTTMVAVGGDCGLTSDCVPNAFCNLDTKKCTARVAADAKCTGKDTSECVDGYFCSSSTKQCTAKLANGASCSTPVMCKSDYCLNTVCDDNNRGLQDLCVP